MNSHLILFAAYPNGKMLADENVQNAIISFVEASWGMGSKALADLFYPEAPSEWVNAFKRYQRESASPQLATNMIKLIYQLDVTNLLHKIDIPTLILHRKNDSAINLSHGQELAYSIPNSRLKILRGKIHFPYYEEPEVIINEILTFLAMDGTISKNASFEYSNQLATEFINNETSRKKDIKRQLAAILSADVKGYSLLMVND